MDNIEFCVILPEEEIGALNPDFLRMEANRMIKLMGVKKSDFEDRFGGVVMGIAMDHGLQVTPCNDFETYIFYKDLPASQAKLIYQKAKDNDQID
jgi:hypothetical protein